MKVYVAKLYSYEYATEIQAQPKIVGVARNREKALRSIYKDLVLEKRIFARALTHYGILEEDDFTLRYPDLSIIRQFRERADRYFDEEQGTLNLQGMCEEFVDDLVEVENIETVIAEIGLYRYEIEEMELLI